MNIPIRTSKDRKDRKDRKMTASMTSKAARVSSLAGVTKVTAKTSKADELVVGAYKKNRRRRIVSALWLTTDRYRRRRRPGGQRRVNPDADERGHYRRQQAHLGGTEWAVHSDEDRVSRAKDQARRVRRAVSVGDS
jgi:hypothetical protein